MARFKQRPEGSTWGNFGAENEWGRLNIFTDHKVLRAVIGDMPTDIHAAARGVTDLSLNRRATNM